MTEEQEETVSLVGIQFSTPHSSIGEPILRNVSATQVMLAAALLHHIGEHMIEDTEQKQAAALRSRIVVPDGTQ